MRSRSKAAAPLISRRPSRTPTSSRAMRRSARASASPGATRTSTPFHRRHEAARVLLEERTMVDNKDTLGDGVSRRTLLKSAGAVAAVAAASTFPAPAVWSAGREGAALPRHRRQPERRHHQEGEGRHRHHHPEHRRHHRRRHQARRDAAELVRHSRHRIFQPEEAGAVGQHPPDGRQEDQGIRQHHADLHQGPAAQRQGDRRPGHRAQEGDVPRRPDIRRRSRRRRPNG